MIKTENPLTKMKIKNKILKILLVISIVSIPVIYYTQEAKFKEYYHSKIIENKELKSHQKLHDDELKKIELDLKKKEAELKKFTVTKLIIRDYIKNKNSTISDKLADAYAVKIIKESNRNGNSPYIQTALLGSESDFTTNPKHAIKTVYGMGGIYYDVWGNELKDKGIITCANDLKNPYINIASSAYALSTFMKDSKSTFIAVAKYKGYSKLGKSQAATVIRIAVSLKEKERNA